MRTWRRTRIYCGVAAIVVGVLVSSSRLMAHDLRLSTIDLIAAPSGAPSTTVIVSVPLSQLAIAEHSGPAGLTAADADAAIRRRLRMTAGALTVAGLESRIVIDATNDAVKWHVVVPAAVGDVIVPMRLLPDSVGAYSLLRIMDARGRVEQRWLTPDGAAPSTGADTQTASPLRDVTVMGFRHVLAGLDHVAFVVGLLLIGGTWRALVVTVTAFTAAHSITLGLAVTGVWVPPARVIEPLIALSIVAIAVENLRRRPTLSRRPYYAFAFGLVHGFGLAGPLRDVAPPGASLAITLAAFNIGVEIAQAAIIAAVWPAMAWLEARRPVWWRRCALAGSVLIGLAGAWWCVARLTVTPSALAQGTTAADAAAARIAASFRPFPSVKTHHDGQFFYVESDGMPEHRLMVGITAWQQQVPLPQAYRGANAWRFPLAATPAASPVSAKTHFFRGAIAIAANGVPIFNPIKNDGRTDTFLAGELDEFGGHGGRADDYHYHLPPLHLQKTLGASLPVAYALDGYPIFGLDEPDGTAPGRLDAYNGHETTAGGYHYHSTRAYPYLNGGFHGEVTERDGQVDPQPSARPVRPSTEPLPGAIITGFERIAPNEFRVTYTRQGQTYAIHYTIRDANTYVFDYVDARGGTHTEVYSGRGRGRGGRQP